MDWIDEIKARLLDVADRVNLAIDKSLEAFFRDDPEKAGEVMELEELLDRMEVELEEHAVSILEREKPEGYPLRFIISALKINNDLERMGDHAVDIATAAVRLHECGARDIPPLLPLMIDRARGLMRKSLKALVEEDMSLSLQVRGEDVVVDRYASEILAELAERGAREPAGVPSFMYILLVVRSVERIADLATNIAEDIIYLVEGTIVRHVG